MGLYVSHMTTLLPSQRRELYVYLLDYGWPDGEYEQIFKKHFQSIAKRASENRAIVIASHRGVHFANEVLSFHQVFELDAAVILPAILITKTHPSYFVEALGPDEHPIPNPEIDELCRNDVILIPLKQACTTPDDFTSLVESIFSDLAHGLTLKDFRVAKHDSHHRQKPGQTRMQRIIRRLGKAIIIEPNIGGIGVDLKKLVDDPKVG